MQTLEVCIICVPSHNLGILAAQKHHHIAQHSIPTLFCTLCILKLFSFENRIHLLNDVNISPRRKNLKTFKIDKERHKMTIFCIISDNWSEYNKWRRQLLLCCILYFQLEFVENSLKLFLFIYIFFI